MAGKNRNFIPNQVFLGLPWKNVRPKYESVITGIKKKYPLHFAIVGRDDGTDAQSLFDIIKERISSSSSAIFDATGGNANVSLEYGYAEGIGVPRTIFLSAHKAAQKQSAGGPIISDLLGMRRVSTRPTRRLPSGFRNSAESTTTLSASRRRWLLPLKACLRGVRNVIARLP